MGLLGDIKDMMQTRSQAKRMQNEIKKISAEYTNGGITVVACGDGSILKISVAEGGYDEVKAGKPQRFETMLLNVVNGAIKKAKTAAQMELAKKIEGLEDLLG